jgi:transketolase
VNPSRRDKANAIRALSMDAVQKAKSGHPGAPMGMADMMEVLWCDVLKHNPANPQWVDRDRFVLSNGHASMLLYGTLHLSGYALSIDDIKAFRQLHSITPGHPEYGDTPGVETTTGPLGQGLANAVGMALAERKLAAYFNRDGHQIVDHHTYVALGDGCLMEGISHEACSLAGTLRLGKLIAIYDDNDISIDGHVSGWFADDTPRRFEAYGWQVVRDIDGHNPEAVAAALHQARAEHDRPTIICCKTTIGYGAPNKQGDADCHGAPLGEDEVALARKTLDWPYAAFEIPDEIYQAWDLRPKGAQHEADWRQRFKVYRDTFPDLAGEFERRLLKNELPATFEQKMAEFISTSQKEGADLASRQSSQKCLGAIGPELPELIGGSADLTGSNGTWWPGSKAITPDDPDGNYIHYGVREFAMTAIANGIALHGGLIPYAATFLTFSDYSRNALRMAAMMKTRCVFIFTHDSIGLGEDGPTHQAVEQAASLRLIPDLSVWRPGDDVETAVAWKAALLNNSGPSALLLSRQTLAHQQRDATQLANIERGGYVLEAGGALPEAVIIATGSELGLALQAALKLNTEGRQIRVVSMPNTGVFDAQSPAYRDQVLPPMAKARVVIEAGVGSGWHKYAGNGGTIISLDRFGASAPGPQLFEHFGFTVERVVAAVNEAIAAHATLN